MNCVRRSSCAGRPVAGGKAVRAGSSPARTYAEATWVVGNDGEIEALDPDELEQLAEIMGTEYADCLITHPRWPTCNQPAAIRAAGHGVDLGIAGIVAILNGAADFRPHTAMMSTTIRNAFWNSLPICSKKVN
jgi:hypothetical protein